MRGSVFVESVAVFCIMLVTYVGIYRVRVLESGDPTYERQTLAIIGVIGVILGVWFGQFQAYIMWYCVTMTLAILVVLLGTITHEKFNRTDQYTVQNGESVI